MARLNDHQFVNACDARYEQKYYCPDCGEQLILRRGQSKVAHFAHRVNSKCVLQKGESYEHLLGKQQIFEWARKHGCQTEIEAYIPQLEQRADILLKISGQRIAIEFQCSPLSLAALQSRTSGYQKVGIKCYWFLGSPYKTKLEQRQTQKFIQLLNHQYAIILWDVKIAAFKVVKLTIKEKSPSLREINQDYRTLYHLSLLQETKPNIKKITGRLPLICHQKIGGIHFTNHPEIYWRCLVVNKLNGMPLFTNFSRDTWFRLLREIDLAEWAKFPCLCSSKIINDYLRVFTKQLLRSGVILMKKQTIILAKHPHYQHSLVGQY